jgi:Ca-activated chloride channel family protein
MKRGLAFPLLAATVLWADAGVLIPEGREKLPPGVISLEEMHIDVLVDNGNARVSIRQVYASHYGAVLEGNYVFALPARAAISDFAIWDGVTRIPGVILERRRAEEIYADLKWQAIDPGLLQQGERDADEARRSALFSARVVPIPAYGTKRVEIEYHERLAVEDLESFFAIPLRPDAYQGMTAGLLSIQFELRTAHPLRDFQIEGRAYPFVMRERTPNSVKGGFEARNIALSEDFAVRYSLAPPPGDSLRVLAHRQDGAGFFEAALLLNRPAAASAAAPRSLVLLFDTSLSMQWEKLERSFQALETVLRSLGPADRFNLLLFNSRVETFAAAPVTAAPAAVEKALEFMKASRLRGGTDLEAALEAALKQSDANTHLVLFSDGGATRGAVQNGKLAAWYTAAWKARRPHTYVYGVGDDANLPLLKMLAGNNGLLEWVRSTEPADFKLKAFVSKIGRQPVENLGLGVAPASNFDLVYPLQDAVFAGSLASWVGQYRAPAAQATFTAGAARATVALPERSLEYPHLPRTWARARVDALLEKIEREGEDAATIDEIVRLSRKYKFVTPYTSFLAAPRALLRPRLIRPGDPVLRVHTDPSVVSVVALFPFGLVKQLRYLSEEDTWQTRFLAPRDLADGTHQVRLILRDRKGQVFRESKSFVIASQPPVVRVQVDGARFRRGETVRLRASASATTRTLTARMYGVGPVQLRWNARAAASTGEFIVPAHLATGRYTLIVTAEDFAHNIASREVSIEVAP